MSASSTTSAAFPTTSAGTATTTPMATSLIVETAPTAPPALTRITPPSRRYTAPQLLDRLHSKIREIAEVGQRLNGTPPDRMAYVIALGAVYLDADFASVRDLLLQVPGGVHVQQAVDPIVSARELFLDAWRMRDDERENAVIMIVDKILVDTNPRSRAQSRMTVYLRPVELPVVVNHKNQRSWTFPVVLGTPNDGAPSGEWMEVRDVLEHGRVPWNSASETCRRWQGALARVVYGETQKTVRHVLPIDAHAAAEIRLVLGLVAGMTNLRRQLP